MSSKPKSQTPDPSSPRSHTVGIRVPLDMYRELVKAAEAERRTLSNYILRLIENDLNRHLLDQAAAATYEGPIKRTPDSAPRVRYAADSGPSPTLNDAGDDITS